MKKYFDGCLISEDFTDEANEFLQAYYEKHYFNDLMGDCAYEIKDTWENYAWLIDLLDSRFAEWQKTKSFKSEPMLKTPKLVGFGKPGKAKLLLFVVIMIFIILFTCWVAKVIYA